MTQAYAPNHFHGLTKKEKNALEFNFDRVVEKVVINIVVRKSPKHLLREVYMAGLYHGTLAANGWADPGQLEEKNDG